MSTLRHIDRDPEQIGIAGLLAYSERAVPACIAADSLALTLHHERMHVACAYVHEYLRRCGRRASLLEIARLEVDRIAGVIAPDLDKKGQIGIADAVAPLVQQARAILNPTVATAEEIISGAPGKTNLSTGCIQAEQALKPVGSPPFPSPIELSSGASLRRVAPLCGDEPTVAPR
ncbi:MULTISPECIES: hypothetical protein [Acidobacterium]|uniref:hypothetical protein n=1 Tax=Acidobacterium TaxID=33973 RepID=UPI0005A1CA1F|nr:MULTISPECIES: hypothetical protein [Acidobacterium]HCT60943.1 hypothetical protein [Acidobacterium sp.]